MINPEAITCELTLRLSKALVYSQTTLPFSGSIPEMPWASFC